MGQTAERVFDTSKENCMFCMVSLCDVRREGTRSVTKCRSIPGYKYILPNLEDRAPPRGGRKSNYATGNEGRFIL